MIWSTSSTIRTAMLSGIARERLWFAPRWVGEVGKSEQLECGRIALLLHSCSSVCAYEQGRRNLAPMSMPSINHPKAAPICSEVREKSTTHHDLKAGSIFVTIGRFTRIMNQDCKEIWNRILDSVLSIAHRAESHSWTWSARAVLSCDNEQFLGHAELDEDSRSGIFIPHNPDNVDALLKLVSKRVSLAPCDRFEARWVLRDAEVLPTSISHILQAVRVNFKSVDFVGSLITSENHACVQNEVDSRDVVYHDEANKPSRTELESPPCGNGNDVRIFRIVYSGLKLRGYTYVTQWKDFGDGSFGRFPYSILEAFGRNFIILGLRVRMKAMYA